MRSSASVIPPFKNPPPRSASTQSLRSQKSEPQTQTASYSNSSSIPTPKPTARGLADYFTTMELPTAIITREPNFASSCVLLIDDEPLVLSLARTTLLAQGFDVACASSGDIAVQLITRAMEAGHRYSACLLDLTMPGGISGFDVLEKLHEIDPALPVIASSGYFQEDARELCRGIGFYDVLPKPYAPDLLYTIVRRAIAGIVDPPAEYGRAEEAAMAMHEGARAFAAA